MRRCDDLAMLHVHAAVASEAATAGPPSGSTRGCRRGDRQGQSREGQVSLVVVA